MDRTWKPREVPDLPDGLVLFDGVCVLCTWWVRFVIARDPAARFRFLPIQTSRGRALAERLGIDPDAPETNAVVLGGRAWFKSDAALRILAGLPGWSWAAALRLLPRPLRDLAYDRVAGGRYWLFGKTDHCLVPTPELARHFLASGPGIDRP